MNDKKRHSAIARARCQKLEIAVRNGKIVLFVVIGQHAVFLPGESFEQ